MRLKVCSFLILLSFSVKAQINKKEQKENDTIIQLSEVEVQAMKKKAFTMRRMKDVEGTSILAGKKTEVILIDQKTANLATNNARQIYGQVVGLNIYDYNDGGLQLGIGGRGLDPNRTANFNTRQNGYDISADVLGYPESYYTPPAEALREVQIIRGAASLQYGTQFGGMINFLFKKPTQSKKIAWNSRQTIGSNNLFTSFNSLEGTIDKFSYYTFYNHKQGDAYRPNSNFNSDNTFGYFNYKFNDKTSLKLEYSYFGYLAQQAGGLTDKMFYENPRFSNRTRNWFKVKWNLFNLNLNHKFNENTQFDLNTFALNAYRKALGFREQRVGSLDEGNTVRDLIVGEFNNWGAEARLINKYKLLGKDNVFLVGAKYYQSRNKSEQGPGTKGSDANFDFDYETSPDYKYQTDFTYPNLNLSVFGENIFRVTPKFSITPGFRFEYIDTKAEGSFHYLIKDIAGGVLVDKLKKDNKDFKRSFILLGLGLSYKPFSSLEIYGNLSQNYRSVTFSDIHTTNPSYLVEPNITDESGFTGDLGFRGNLSKVLSYDTNIFVLRYNKKIGTYIYGRNELKQDIEKIKNKENIKEQKKKQLINTLRSERLGKVIRDNIGDAVTYGVELFTEVDWLRMFNISNREVIFTSFINSSFSSSEYISSKRVNVVGKKIQYSPNVNLKTGLNLGYKNFLGALQYTYVSKQYSDDTNAEQDVNENYYGTRGAVPPYGVMDLSLSYTYKRYKLEAGVNNLLNNHYFVRRATGYPGPGIIPSDPRTFYLTFGFHIP